MPKKRRNLIEQLHGNQSCCFFFKLIHSIPIRCTNIMSTELVSLYVGFWTLNTYYYYVQTTTFCKINYQRLAHDQSSMKLKFKIFILEEGRVCVISRANNSCSHVRTHKHSLTSLFLANTIPEPVTCLIR